MTKGCGHIFLLRLPIEKCKVAIVNTHCGAESEIHEALPYDVRDIDILRKDCLSLVCITDTLGSVCISAFIRVQ